MFIWPISIWWFLVVFNWFLVVFNWFLSCCIPPLSKGILDPENMFNPTVVFVCCCIFTLVFLLLVFSSELFYTGHTGNLGGLYKAPNCFIVLSDSPCWRSYSNLAIIAYFNDMWSWMESCVVGNHKHIVLF